MPVTYKPKKATPEVALPNARTLELLVQLYYCDPDDLEDKLVSLPSKAEVDAKSFLINHNLLNSDLGKGLTERGTFFVQHLLRQPLPKVKEVYYIPKLQDQEE